MGERVKSIVAKLLASMIVLGGMCLPIKVQALNNNSVLDTNQVSKNSKTTQNGKVNVKSLNVRKGAGTKYSKIGTLSKGNTVQIQSKTSSGWYKIKYKNTYGYVSSKYIKITQTALQSTSATSKETTIKYTGTTTASLNVRKGGSTSYSKIGGLKKGNEVQIIVKLSNGWYKIKFNNTYGYISGQYVKNVKEINSSNSNSTPSVEGRVDLNNFLFIGDSFTYLLKDTIESNNKNVYVYAKSGSMPGYWIDKVSSMPKNANVDGIVLLIGVNGAAYESNKTNVKTLINKLSTKYPNKTIYVQKIFPVGKEFKNANPSSFNQKITGLNKVIESHCKVVENAIFIDTTSGFVDSKGYLINHNGDGLHIATKYNNKFYNNIFNVIKKLDK